MNNTRSFEHHINDIDDIARLLPLHDITHVLVKALPKNANDKNQVYWSSDFEMLSNLFDLEFTERDYSLSTTKQRSDTSKKIPEATFKSFYWLDTNSNLVEAPNVKMLIYAQYPEMRLSGFKTVENQIPASMSVSYVKEQPHIKRLFVLARTKQGKAIGMMALPNETALEQCKKLPSYLKSKVVHLLLESSGATDSLKAHLKPIVGRWLPGVRLDKLGDTIPFNGTQVCGYTLEHALGIRPNADQDGDFMGIELKTHTMNKVTLMTPEPDMGEYAADFKLFMEHRGYWKEADKAFRFTGTHTAGVRHEKTQLTMQVVNYDQDKSLSSQWDQDIYIGLFTDDGVLAAGWSKERILNNWNAKHNETVYIKAIRKNTEDLSLKATSHNYEVSFNTSVVWCKVTSPKRLLDAIISGVIVFDPAPKYVPSDPSKSKRRSQWRVNNIYKALEFLYESVEKIEITEN